MNVKEIINNLKKEFPDKNIVLNPKNKPTEILCEVDPSSFHPNYSEAVTYIKSSAPHKHLKAEEIYRVEKGRLIVYLDGVTKIIEEGQSIVINPEVIHWAKGDWTRVFVRSEPGWIPGDHIPVKKALSAGGIVVKEGKILFVKFPNNIGITFPKGHVEKGETYEQTALREVREETGLKDLQIVKKMGMVTRPAIEMNGDFVIKDIHLFLIKIVGDSIGKADEQTEWLSFDEALTRLLPQESEFLRSVKNELI